MTDQIPDDPCGVPDCPSYLEGHSDRCEECEESYSRWIATAASAIRVANYDRNDNDTALCDLLTHLRHWADSEGIDFANAIRRADFHYEAEAIQSEPADLAININTAKVIDLATLPGVGHHVALNIELYREAFGPFKHKTDLMNVRGISERVYLGLTDRITV